MVKQNHLPFVEWINSEEPLLPEQARALQEHLRECESCRQLRTSWGEVRRLIQTTPAASPAAGFTARWQDRLARERKIVEQRQRRQGLVALGVTSSIAAALFLLLLSGASGILDDPVQYLFLYVYRLTTLFSSVLSLRDFVLEFLRPAVSTLPPLLWLLIPGVITLAGVLWVVAIRTLATSRRVFHENE